MAQESSQLPTFGNWESGDDVPYTAYFERAREGKGRGKRNIHGAQSDYETYITSEPSNETSSIQKEGDQGSRKAAESKAAMSKPKHYRSGAEADKRGLIGSTLHRGTIGEKTALGTSRPYNSGIRKPKTKAEQVTEGQNATRPSHEYRIRAKDYDHRRRIFSDSMLHQDPRYGRVAAESPVHRDGGIIYCSSPNRFGWQNPQSKHVKSSSHYTQHASVGAGGGQMSSSVQEKRYSSTNSRHSAAPMTPGRSRFKSPNHGIAVPKFGDWDETNPSSANGYTHVFNQVVEEKKAAAGATPVTTTETPHSNGQYLRTDTRSESQGCWCFLWRGK